MEIAIGFLIVVVVVALTVLRYYQSEIDVDFKRKDKLFTPVERNFIELLEQAIGPEYRLLCRVCLGDLLQSSSSGSSSANAIRKARNKDLNFVVCRKSDMKPIAAVDLVNPSEKYKNTRDWFVSGALDSARIAYIRIKVKAGYKPQDIKAVILNKVQAYGETMPAAAPKIPQNKRPTRPLRSSRRFDEKAA